MTMKRLTLCVLLCAAMAGASYSQDFFTKAKASLTAGDTAAAVSAFQEAVRAGQKAADANYYLGTIALAQRKVDEAIGFLQTSVRINDENVDALKALGDALMKKKDAASALANYRRAAKLAPKNAAVHTGLGLALLAADSIDAAIITLTRAKEYAPENAAIYSALGDCYQRQNVLPLAITNYQKAVDLSPKDIPTHRKLAQMHFKSRQYVEAVKEYRAIQSIDSTYAEGYLEEGRIYVLAKQYRNAIPSLRRFVGMRPKSVDGAVFYAKALFGADDFADAAKESQRALGMDSSNTDMWRINAHSNVEIRDYAAALASFGGLERRKAVKAEDQSKIGAALFGLGREDEAMKALLAAVANDSTNCEPYFSLGFLYMKRQDYTNAAAMFEKKIVCDPRSLSAHVNGAACYMQLKNFGRARELLFKVIELKPDFLQGRLWLGRYYAQVDSLDLAKDQYDSVIKEIGADTEKYKKEAGEAYSMTGSYFFATQKYERAVDAFRRALTFNYDNSQLRMSLGQAVLQTLDPNSAPEENRRKIEDAIRQFRRALEQEPNSVQGHLWLAQSIVLSRVEGEDEVNRRLVEEACNECRKVLRLDPRNSDAKKLMERIGCK